MINLICTGHETCLKDCECKNVHDILVNHFCYEEGSCWHNDHTDGKFHEEYHRSISVEELKNIKRTKLIDKMCKE
jgi:hypothetical protein